jgi:hypothetical protein
MNARISNARNGRGRDVRRFQAVQDLVPEHMSTWRRTPNQAPDAHVLAVRAHTGTWLWT